MNANKLTREDLYGLERYAAERPAFRERVIRHKRARRLAVGPNATLHFEDRLTMQYQVQEILRTERIFEPAEIEAELEAYNPLIPDGSNWKATFMIEFEDEDERRAALARLVGIEDRVWVRVRMDGKEEGEEGDEAERVWAVPDEDLERAREEKTSSVHFLRFELPPEHAAAARAGAPVAVGIDHPQYPHRVDPVPEAVRAALAADLSPPPSP